MGELAALRPTQVMRALYRGITAVAAADTRGTPLVAGGGGGSGVGFWILPIGVGGGDGDTADTASVDGFG